MPRRNRPQQSRRKRRTHSNSRRRSSEERSFSDLDGMTDLSGNYSLEADFDGEWHVRQIPAWRAVKPYTCPNCQRQIPQGQAHVVAWRSDWIFGDEEAGSYRRHWHTACWRNRKQDMRF